MTFVKPLCIITNNGNDGIKAILYNFKWYMAEAGNYAVLPKVSAALYGKESLRLVEAGAWQRLKIPSRAASLNMQ